jgi:hypothetical protein
MDEKRYSRRDFMALAGIGGLVFASGLPGCAGFGQGGGQDFSFVQLTDVHWATATPRSIRTGERP